jgi:hypothetical protein
LEKMITKNVWQAVRREDLTSDHLKKVISSKIFLKQNINRIELQTKSKRAGRRRTQLITRGRGRCLRQLTIILGSRS